MIVAVKFTEVSFTIFIDELPHLFLSPIPSGFQSFIDDNRLIKHVIEYYWNDRTIETEYETKELWTEILKQLLPK